MNNWTDLDPEGAEKQFKTGFVESSGQVNYKLIINRKRRPANMTKKVLISFSAETLEELAKVVPGSPGLAVEAVVAYAIPRLKAEPAPVAVDVK